MTQRKKRNKTMIKNAPAKQLPRKRENTHGFLIHFPKELWNRMIEHGLAWGTVTKFIVDAVTEKLDREGLDRAAYKEMDK
jgi:hypothetical protein